MIKKNTTLILLLLIFLIALIVRFWWFPKNVYFGYDQARDAIISQEIFKQKDFKIIGPSAGKDGLFHGPFYWYLIGLPYLIANGNPNYILAFISVLNASGVFLIYFFGKTLFEKKAGLLAAFLYALSFSQTQYALYFANPSPAVLSITLLFLGWALLIFKRKNIAWMFIGLGYGLSVQFEFFLLYLFFSVPLFLLFYWQEIKERFQLKSLILGLFMLVLSLISFILTEFKFDFRTIKTLFTIFFQSSSGSSGVKLANSTFLGRFSQEMTYGLVRFPQKFETFVPLVFLCFWVIILILDKKNRKKILLLFIWIMTNVLVDFFGSPQLYYVSIGMSAALLLFYSFFLEKLLKNHKTYLIIILLLIISNNIYFIKKYNPKGPIQSLYVQEGMLLENEKMVIDKIYKDAKGVKFTVNALTMPYKIKTTWAYLFNWYGKQKYGYLPFWGGEDVPGYAGVLPIPDSDKYVRFAIFEPMRGIPEELKKEFTDSENGYGLPVWVEKIGYFEVQKRIPNR